MTAEVGAISGVFGDPEKAGTKLNVSNLAIIQRAATASDRSDLKPPWLTASGQTAILLIPGEGERGLDRNLRNNPMQSRLPMHRSPRCGARTRSGMPCRSPAMTNGRCRMHGGTSPGAPVGNTNAFKHGLFTAAAIAERREVAALIRGMKSLVEQVDGQD